MAALLKTAFPPVERADSTVGLGNLLEREREREREEESQKFEFLFRQQ